MSDPIDYKEYEARATNNTLVEGYGFDVKTHIPCPFCAASDWLIFPITAALDDYKDVTKPNTCKECGRTSQMLVTREGDGGLRMEIVQTAGDDPPPWLNPPPRRINESRTS